jgi:hypothetical protein
MLKFVVLMQVLFFLSAPYSRACMTSGASSNSTIFLEKFRKTDQRKLANEIPLFADQSTQFSLESKLGNLLLKNNSRQIVLSVPAVIQKSSFHPFGDGQSNSKLSFGPHWKQNEFPVVGVQETVEGKSSRKYLFHPSLKITDYSESLVNGSWYKVQPKGWADSFYFSFETSVLKVNDFLAGIPLQYRTFSQNRVAPNLAKIAKSSGVQGFTNLGEGYNAQAWYSDNVHGFFPDSNGSKTAVGGVITWGIVDKKFGPFKNLYTCFEARNKKEEKLTGAPSGAGWHLIGDAAETLFNNLETKPLPIAKGRSHGFSEPAYELTESLTATWLQTDEVLVSEKGTFHWYLNPYESTVCTEIWVHNCVPNLTNNWGFNCQ